ncbi:MAG: phosphoribosylamine--glycine ligase [Candidatus Azotimanducaceae bacterium]|jgi:phosphoribosylamine--glycine ligase
MKVLVTGNGGREHALAWKLGQSSSVTEVFVAPGNAGTAVEPGIKNVDLDVLDIDSQIAFAKQQNIELVVIGPEAPLVAGAVDQFTAAGIRCFGPSMACAQLEGSKDFTKQFLARHGIPTAAYQTFSELAPAIKYARSMTAPIVVKADGLAAGKGVVVASDHDEAERALKDMLEDNAFGDAGARVVIEEFLEGEEASFIVIADGETFLPFASSQDHKAAYDGDRGPNTGGMGAYSPAPVVTDAVYQRIVDQVISPTIAGLANEGMPYVGFLYAGLMIDSSGQPKVIEFNCRFGDPETQPIMMRLQSDLATLCVAAIDQSLDKQSITFNPLTALTVVMAAGGYPDQYAKGDVIQGIAAESSESKTFHAGTTLDAAGQTVTNGGRVLGVTALGSSVGEANKKAYERVKDISFANAEYRTDIGYRAIERETIS